MKENNIHRLLYRSNGQPSYDFFTSISVTAWSLCPKDRLHASRLDSNAYSLLLCMAPDVLSPAKLMLTPRAFTPQGGTEVLLGDP